MIMLDDIGKAAYKRLKADSDRLVKIQCEIRCKKRLIEALVEQWLDYEKCELDVEADRAYGLKHAADGELQQLEQLEAEITERIRKYAHQKTRSA